MRPSPFNLTSSSLFVPRAGWGKVASETPGWWSASSPASWTTSWPRLTSWTRSSPSSFRTSSPFRTWSPTSSTRWGRKWSTVLYFKLDLPPTSLCFCLNSTELRITSHLMDLLFSGSGIVQYRRKAWGWFWEVLCALIYGLMKETQFSSKLQLFAVTIRQLSNTAKLSVFLNRSLLRFAPGLWSRSRSRTFSVGVEFFLSDCDSGSPIELFFTSHSWIGNSCLNATIYFETFVDPEISCYAPSFPLILTTSKFNFLLTSNLIPFTLRSRSGKFWKGRSRIVYLRLRNPDLHMWSWILGNDWKNIISSTSGRNGIFAKS